VNRGLVAIGAGIVAVAALLAVGAAQIRGDAGYAGAGPAFLPWVVAAVLAVLGLGLVRAGWRVPDGADAAAGASGAPAFPPDWHAMLWVSAGVLANALLIERLGFVLSCGLLFALGARGFRISAQEPAGVRQFALDLLGGLLLSAPVFWLFTKALSVNLPGLLKGGWI
jgi:putative tricarboxylic transport membrane protein